MVKQALEILTPVIPGRMEDGNVGQGHDKEVKVISKEIKIMKIDERIQCSIAMAWYTN